MPVYEFHCPRCNLLLEFFARRATSRVPACPHCGGALSREVSSFSTGPSGGRDEAEALGGSRVDDARAQRAVEALGGRLDAIANDSDPRAAARAVREFSEASGLSLSPDVKDMVARLERGADPEKVGAELDQLVDEGGEPFRAENAVAGAGAPGALPSPVPTASAAAAPPRRDPVLHEMPPEPLPPRRPSAFS